MLWPMTPPSRTTAPPPHLNGEELKPRRYRPFERLPNPPRANAKTVGLSPGRSRSAGDIVLLHDDLDAAVLRLAHAVSRLDKRLALAAADHGDHVRRHASLTSAFLTVLARRSDSAML